MMNNHPCPAIYIMTNKPYGTLYTGVTHNLIKRIYQHKKHLIEGFTKQYGCTRLVYFEQFDSLIDAIVREKQIKAGSRKRKIGLIQTFNPKWDDLYYQLI